MSVAYPDCLPAQLPTWGKSDGRRSRLSGQFGWALCGVLRAQQAAAVVAVPSWQPWGSRGICRRNWALCTQSLAPSAPDRIPGSWSRARGGTWWHHLVSGGTARETQFYTGILILSLFWTSEETWVKASAAPLCFVHKLSEKNGEKHEYFVAFHNSFGSFLKTPPHSSQFV